MGYSLLAIGQQTSGLALTGNNYSAFVGGAFYQQATEPAAAIPMPVGGVLSGLTVAQGVNTGSWSGQLRRNAANANQAISNSAPTSAANDVFGAGDQIDLAWGTSTAGVVGRVQAIFRGLPFHAAVYGSPGQNGSSPLGGNNNFYLSFFGYNGAFVLSQIPTVGVYQRIGAAGTLQGLAVTLSANAAAGVGTVALFKNGANANGIISIGAGLTGAFQDTTHQDAVIVGDQVCGHWFANGNQTVQALCVGFVNPTANSNDVYAFVQSTVPTGSTARYCVFGQTLGFASDALAQIAFGFATTLSGEGLYIQSNAATATSTFGLHKNGAAANQTVSIGAGLTGWFNDTTHTDACTATDAVNHVLVNGGGGTLGIGPLALVSTSSDVVNSPSDTLITTSAASVAPTTGNFGGFAGNTGSPGNYATESPIAYPWPAAGVISGLSAYAPAQSGTWGLQFRKNGASGNQAISNAALASNLSDAVAAGDLIDLQWTTGGSAPIVNAIFASADGTHWANYVGTHLSGVGFTPPGVVYPRFYGAPGGSSVESGQQSRVATPGTISGSAIILMANSTTVTSQAGWRRNGVTVRAVNIGAGLTGLFQFPPVTKDPVAAGDLICGYLSNGNPGGSITFSACGVSFQNTASATNDGFNAFSGVSITVPYYARPTGSFVNSSSSEAFTQLAFGFSVTLSLMEVQITANVASAASTLVSRVNGANGNQLATIGAGLTGWFQDTANIDTLGPTTLANMMLTPGAGGLTATTTTMAMTSAMVWAQSVSESGAAADTVTLLTTLHGTTISETGAALDTVSSNAAYPSAVSEAGAAADTVSSRLASSGDRVSESGAALDTPTSANALPMIVAESGAALDTQALANAFTLIVGEEGIATDASSSAYAPSFDRVSESGAAVDAAIAQYASTATTVFETGDALDTVTAIGAYGTSVIEGGVANDIVFSFLGFAGNYTLEQANAVDTPRVIALVTRPFVYEQGFAYDVSAPGNTRANFVAETGAAQDVSDGFNVIPKMVIEQGDAQDAQIALGRLAYENLTGMSARVVHRHPVVGNILDDETIPLLDDQGVRVFEDS